MADQRNAGTVMQARFLERLRNALDSRLDRLVGFTVDVIYGRESSFTSRLWGSFLFVLSLLYRGVVVLRQQMYRHRILRAQHLGCLVVVVGNLTVGGTGKTPVVEKLARTLHARGRKVAILSRGYKSRKEPLVRKWIRWITHQPPEPPRVVSDGEKVFFNSEVAGDEPYMLARNLPGVVVVTDKDRVKAGRFAIRKFGVDTLILDDGFQYYQLQDHLQLLLIDKTNPFGNGQLLPRGILREPVRQMRRASYVFLTKSDGPADAALQSTLLRHREEREWIECRHNPEYLQEVLGNRRMPLEWLQSKRVGALSGIAVPESFEAFLEQFGAAEVIPFRYLDHHRFTPEELQSVASRARRAGIEVLVTTEKDAVRIEPDYNPEIPFFFLRVEIKLLSGADSFDEVVRRICFPGEGIPAGPAGRPPRIDR